MDQSSFTTQKSPPRALHGGLCYFILHLTANDKHEPFYKLHLLDGSGERRHSTNGAHVSSGSVLLYGSDVLIQNENDHNHHRHNMNRDDDVCDGLQLPRQRVHRQ